MPKQQRFIIIIIIYFSAEKFLSWAL